MITVPTAGWNYKEGRPNPSGISRIRRAAEKLRSLHVDSFISFVGGWPDCDGINLAEHYLFWFCQEYPDLKERCAFHEGRNNCTIRDYEGAIGAMDKFFQIENDEKSERARCRTFIVTYPLHARKVAKVLRNFGYTACATVESKEPLTSLQWLKEFVQSFYTFLDPLWRMPIGCLLVKMADKKAQRYLESTKAPG